MHHKHQTTTCKAIGCDNCTEADADFCRECAAYQNSDWDSTPREEASSSMAAKYPKYYKPVGTLTEVDVYAVHKLFDLQDASGALHHASKKLLLSGVRTGGKSSYKDIEEARDTLTRWLQLYEDDQ